MTSTTEVKKRGTRGKSAAGEVARLRTRIQKLTALLDVAKAMTAERGLDALLRLILEETCRVLGADRCTIWIVDRDRNELWTKLAQGLDSGQKIRIPMGIGIAGQVASRGEVINIPDAYADPRFNPDVDKKTGYHTKHILGIPMRYNTGEVTGVLQVLNKLDGSHFADEDVEIAMALGANAAAAVENAILYEEIDQLFEGFVHASVTAIESRDPTTSGHSERVAVLTLGLAEQLPRFDKGSYRGVRFTSDDLREIRYAALLHDFGKVGVREHVLTKEKKLFGAELELIEARFRTRHAASENAYLRSTIESLTKGGTLPSDYEAAVKRDAEELESFLAFIRQCNEPAVLEAEGFDRLRELSRLSYMNTAGNRAPLLQPRELERLAIPIGSLDPQERLEIESHVTHTFRFLTQIPWTRHLKRVPEFAYGHHERIDGSGYPRQLHENQIPVQTRMMSIADIYDALTAHDRPYKPAVPHEKAVDILVHESKRGHIDAELVSVFIEAKVHERLAVSR